MSNPVAKPSKTATLPYRDSPDLCLDHPTSAERTEIWEQSALLWGNALPLPQYLEECKFMLTVPLAHRDGMTSWILVDRNAAPNQRIILSCCRTIRKRAIVSEQGGNVQEGIVHGVSAFFCNPQYRGHGYAARMMTELAKVLRSWQISDEEPCVGSILYSDIGIKFYRTVGWIPARNNIHFEFPAELHPAQPGAVALRTDDLDALCKADEVLMRKEMAIPSGRTKMAILADHEHMLWHHAKEEFVFEKIYSRKPELKGVMVGERGKRVWAIWSHRLYCPPSSEEASGNTLYILRLVVENSRDATSSEDQMEIKAKLEAVIRAAQNEAALWRLSRIKFWNPTSLVEKLIEWTGIRYERVDRTQASVASLLWYGESNNGYSVEWFANEKYAWC